MSIEQERIDTENAENSLEQYGVWVKKSPAENVIEDSADLSQATDDNGVMGFDEEDFNTDSLEIFSEDESASNVDFDLPTDDFDFDQEETIEDDVDNTTLTSDELLNITSNMNTEETVEKSLEGFDSSELDMDFDSFSDADFESSENDADIEESDENGSINSELNQDFDLMSDDSLDSIADSAAAEDDSMPVFEDSDDFEISFDDFMEDNTVTDSIDTSDEIENTLDDESAEDTVAIEDDDFDSTFAAIETDEVSFEEGDVFGEEISLDDIPNSEASISVNDNFESEENNTQDINLSIDSDGSSEETVATDTQSSLGETNSSVLNQIVAELSNLRNEMSQFKSELAKIKTEKGSTAAKADSADESGFFSDYEGDDTIALSGDELNNILTSADFTVDEAEEKSETVDAETEFEHDAIETEEVAFDHEESITEEIEFGHEESTTEEIEFDNEESTTEEIVQSPVEETENNSIENDYENDSTFEIDDLEDDYFSNDENEMIIEDKELVEPTLDDIDFDIDSDDNLPDEIDVPVIEDLVVDSSPVNFFDDEEDAPKELDDSAMEYLEDEAIDESGIIDETEDSFDDLDIDEHLSSEISDSEIIESYIEPDSNSPVSSVFKSDQWESDVTTDDDASEPSKPVGNDMQDEIKSVLSYMDRLLESLPEEKISEFAQSEYFGRYKKLFSDLGIS